MMCSLFLSFVFPKKSGAFKVHKTSDLPETQNLLSCHNFNDSRGM